MENYDVCKGPECVNPVDLFKHGLCTGHYQQQYHGRDLKPIRNKVSENIKKTCGVTWCPRGRKSRGLCTVHASMSWRMSIHPEELPRVLKSRICDLCGVETEKPNLDHDHSCCPGGYSCGKCLRGILCYGCNISIGHMERLTKRVGKRVAEYILKPPGVRLELEYEAATVDNHPARIKKE